MKGGRVGTLSLLAAAGSPCQVRTQHPVRAAALLVLGKVGDTSGDWLRGAGVGSRHGCLSQPALDRPAQQLPGPLSGADPPSSCVGRVDTDAHVPPVRAVGDPPLMAQVGVLASAHSDPEGYPGVRAWPGWASVRLGAGHSAMGEARPRFPHPDTRDCASSVL